MIGRSGRKYKAHKDNVIDLFEKYKAKRGELYGGDHDGIDIKFLESRIESLRKGKFTLAVAGEVKAGKSTFINALLGAEILPTDVLQTSSAIVEIFKSDKSFLKVKYADGQVEIIYDNPEASDTKEANERLRELCKINDEYREIPSTLIDDYIIKSDIQITVDEDFIKFLEQKSGAHLQNKHAVIEKYISERTKDKIPVEIEFGYPLKWEFDKLRIVDSPGVNAIGGVQDISFRFFEEANAILFVHPIKPIESKSFREFVNSVISNLSKETLFLILTHAGHYPNDEVERLHAEACRQYKNVIPENRILVVDSLLKLIHSELANGITIQKIRKCENKKKILSSYREQAEDEKRELIDVVYDGSRFEKMFAAINEFSMKAPNLQLQEILEKIKAGYEKQEILYTEKAKILETKKRNPQEFEEEINRIYEALEKYKLLTKQTKEDLKSNYSGRHSSWQKDIDALKVKYPELITGSISIYNARKNTLDALDAVQDKVNDFLMELTQSLGEALEKIGKEFNKEHKITIPEVDLNALEGKAKNSAFNEEDTYEWRKHHFLKFWKWGNRDYQVKTGKKKVFDDNKFLGAFKTECNEAFYKIVNDLPNKSKEVLDIYLDLFSKEMDAVIGDRQKALENEKEKKQSNEEMIQEIIELARKKNDIQPEKKRCIEVLEDLK